MDEVPESTAVSTVEPVDPIAAVAAELAGLRAEVARAHERAAARERTIDRLHDENERLRAGERQMLLRPVLTDLQRLRHEMLRTAARLPARFSGQQATELLCSYARDLELTLERGGVEVLSPRTGDPLDPTAHRVTGTVDATGPEQDGTVAEVVLDGYRDVQADRVVCAPAVRVHRWTPPMSQDEPTPEPIP